ncbi:MAG: sulfotransferase [Pseudomonadota bacterium]
MTRSMSQEVCIVFGALRSGTTLLRLMLDGHPNLHCPGETDFLFDALERRGDAWVYDRAALEANRIYRASIVNYPDDLDGVDALQAMIDQIRAPGVMPVLMLHRGMERAAELLPNAHVIHLRRDPRDVARSSIGMGWAGNVFYGASHWLETASSWNKGAPKLASEPLDVFYEELIPDTEGQLRKVCAHLGLDYERGMLAYTEGTTYSAPDPSLTYQWKRKQSPREVALVEARLGQMLVDYGYEPSDHPPIPLTGATKLSLKLEDWVARQRFRINRFGLGTVLKEKIARRLGLKGLQASTQLRIDEITAQHLK